jgi:hypothetical protein
VLAVVAGIGIFTYGNVEVWTPLQRWYWIQYLNTKNFPSPSGDYQVLAKVDRHGQRRMAVNADVMAGAPQGRQLIPFALSQQAKQAGAGEYARVEQLDARANRITIERENGEQQSYDPRRLSGVAVYREVQRAFSQGDRVQFTAPSKDLHVANRELGTIEGVSHAGNLEIRIETGREVGFNISEHPHLDHGYALTSHSSQGQTAERVLIHVDTDKGELLVNSRFAYVSISRGRCDARKIYTNDRTELA